MELIIRSAKNDDKEKLTEFLSEVNGEHYKSLAAQYVQAMFSDIFRKPHFVIALDKKEIVGAAAYSEELFTVNTWGISWVSVKEIYRGRGIGQKLLEECLSQMSNKTKNTITVILDTYPEKTGLYDRLGFRVLGYDHEGGMFMTKTIEHQSL